MYKISLYAQATYEYDMLWEMIKSNGLFTSLYYIERLLFLINETYSYICYESSK